MKILRWLTVISSIKSLPTKKSPATLQGLFFLVLPYVSKLFKETFPTLSVVNCMENFLDSSFFFYNACEVFIVNMFYGLRKEDDMDESKVKTVRFEQPITLYAGVENFDRFVEDKFQMFIREGYKYDQIKVATYQEGDNYVAVFKLCGDAKF